MKRSKQILINGAVLAGIYTLASTVAKYRSEDQEIDKDNPYLSMAGIRSHNNEDSIKICKECRNENTSELHEGAYENVIKHALDRLLSFMGLIVLSPVFLIISIAILFDDPGPIFFTQKRIAKDKHYFMCHKFRSMAVSTPHDVPTHLLSQPDAYITRVGKVLRKTSLDELPQIWDIFRGKMSIIGPRPALWNQEDLVEEREKVDANSVLPGLSGLAQIKGRDELEITEKARLDGEYVKKLRQGGLKAFLFDSKMFFGTIGSVLRREGVVEGGTGSLTSRVSISTAKACSKEMHIKDSRPISNPKANEVGFEEYGCYKHFHIDRKRPVKLLITGAGSYIGESFKNYCESYYPNINIAILDMTDNSWREADITPYDAVLHVAGIAHADVGGVPVSEQEKYYTINTDLAVECARKSRESGIKQFIFMSSMIIYGDEKFIDFHTIPRPINFYGDSKWLADKGVRAEAGEGMVVAVIRSPMIYGKGSKGNYPVLAKIARKLRFFPDIDNKRSMLYVENFCEFAGQLVCSGEGGIYFPQNREYSRTSSMVQEIAEVSGKRVKLIKLLSPAVNMASYIPGKVSRLIEKAFGSSYYAQALSVYDGLDYQKISLEESIKLTER